MSETVVCPTCKTNYESKPLICAKCGFPFLGTEKEKAIFIGKQISKKSQISDTQSKIKRARVILWVIGGLMFVSGFFIKTGGSTLTDSIEVVIRLVIGLIFIAFGFLTYKKPLISILIPLILLLLNYTIAAIINPYTLMQGFVLKIIFLGSLGYALLGIFQAEKIKKESDFLNEHDYK